MRPNSSLAPLFSRPTDRSVPESAPQHHPAAPSAAMPPKRDAGASCRTVADVQAKLDTQAGRTGAPAPPPAAAGSPPPLPPAARRLPLVGTQASTPTALQVQQLETLLSTGEKKVKNLGLSFSNSIFKRAQVRPGGRRAAARGEGWRGCRWSLQ